MLWLLAIICLSTFVYAFMFKPSKKLNTLHRFMDIEEMRVATREHYRERTFPETRNLVTNEQLESQNIEKNQLIETIELASEGSYPHRQLLFEETKAFLMSSAFNIEKLEDLSCVSFINAKQMTPNEKFEVMMYYIQKELETQMREAGTFNDDSVGQFEAFNTFINMFEILENDRPLRTNPDYTAIYITDKDIDVYFDVFMAERNEDITVMDAISITAILINQGVFGFSKVDTLVYQSIDEIQIGVGGTEHGSKRHIASPLNSVLVSINNVKVRLQFLRFDSKKDLENTIIALTEYGSETFTPKDGFKFTTLRNLRRVTSRREPVADGISTNIRKLATGGLKNVDLLKKNPVKISGTELVGYWLDLLAMAKMCIIFSGGQGTGKSSHAASFTELLGPDVAIRALGNIDEFRLRDRNPEFDHQHYFYSRLHDIHDVSGLARRTNGMYKIMAEIIKKEDAQEAINNFTSGYLGGCLTTHSATASDSIKFLGQLLAMGQNTSTNDTQSLCASVMSTFIGVQKKGSIYHFSTIDEIIPRDWKPKFKDIDPLDPMYSFAYNSKIYQENKLDPSIFEVRSLVKFDRATNMYMPNESPSIAYLEKLYFRLDSQNLDFFFWFLQKYYKLDAKEMLKKSGAIVEMKAGA